MTPSVIDPIHADNNEHGKEGRTGIAGNMAVTELPDSCVHALFARQAARTPDAVALILGERRLSYRELDERANQVAHHLHRHGVSHDDLVGVCLGRSPEMVIALLAAWKAGAAYVPLDPAYPRERLAFMVRDAGLRLLLTERSAGPLFAESGVPSICLDSDGQAIAAESGDAPAVTNAPADLAYVMYTSGSSGQPKGAMITHRGLLNYLCWAIGAYGFVPGGWVPLHSSISFDLTVTSLYPPLLVGGQVELIPDSVGAQTLLAALRRNKDFNVLKITPAHLELLSQQLRPEEMAGFSGTIVIGGENLHAESLRVWRRYAPRATLVNEYGPTETVVGCCIHEVRASDPDSGIIPIGRPIANTRLYVLDEDRQPLPAGVAGELYIGGAGVARGYLNRPELTQERFIADPFTADTGDRLYRTGDLARCRDDGILECLGRTDSQVKVRGYRIELGEIEANLAAHEAVQSCVVLAPEVAPGNRQLVACVVAHKGRPPPTAQALQHFLGERLPEFMVPERLLFLDAFPLTNNGKIDRQALLEHIAAPTRSASATAAAGTSLEERIAAIWRDILKLEHIAAGDNFFDLGGRSLTAVRVISRMREAFAVDLSLRDLFEHPTIAELAAATDGLLWLSRPQGQPGSGIGSREEIML